MTESLADGPDWHLRSEMSESVLTYENSMDSIPAEKVLKRTQLDLQKRFPIHHVCPKCPSLRLGIPTERLSIPPGIG